MIERFKTLSALALLFSFCPALSSCSALCVYQGAHLEAEGQYEKAIAEWDRAILINPKSSISYYHRAYDNSKLGNYEKAVDDATKSIDFSSKESGKTRAYVARANAYMHLNKYQSAVEDASQAIKLSPRSGTAYFFRSQCYKKLGLTDLANADMAKADELGYTSEPSKPQS